MPTDKSGKMTIPYPEGMGTRAAKILDGVGATVVTHALLQRTPTDEEIMAIDAARADRNDISSR